MSIWSNIVKRLGETISFGETNIKASLKQSTKAVYSLANRAYYVEGQNEVNAAIAVGSYFTRPCDNSNIYFVVSLTSDNAADDVQYMYAAKCNAEITIARKSAEPVINEFEEETYPFNTIFSGVKVFRDFAVRSQKSTNDGLLDQTIYTLMLPHSFMLSEGDRVVMKTNVAGEYKDQNYKVESISSALVDLSGVGGIDFAQLSLDLR